LASGSFILTADNEELVIGGSLPVFIPLNVRAVAVLFEIKLHPKQLPVAEAEAYGGVL
jgi:hypothetical protein